MYKLRDFSIKKIKKVFLPQEPHLDFFLNKVIFSTYLFFFNYFFVAREVSKLYRRLIFCLWRLRVSIKNTYLFVFPFFISSQCLNI